MSVEIKATTGSFQKPDTTKQHTLFDAATKGGDKRSGSNGFSSLFGDIISIARASFVPELQNQNKETNAKITLVDQEREGDGKSVTLHDTSTRDADARKRDDARLQNRDNDNDASPVNAREKNSDNDAASRSTRESQAPTDRKSEAGADRPQQEKNADQAVYGRDNDQQNTKGENKQANADDKQTGVAETENKAIADSTAKNSTTGTQTTEGANQTQAVATTGVGNVGSGDEGIAGLDVKNLLGLLLAVQDVLRLAIQNAEGEGFDASQVVNKIATLVNGGLSADERQALLNVVNTLATVDGKGMALNKEALAKGLPLEKIVDALRDALQGSNSNALARALAKIASGLEVSALQKGEIDKGLLDRLHSDIARTISNLKSEGSGEVTQKSQTNTKITPDGTKANVDGVKITFEGSKAGSEGVQKTGTFDSRVLDELQGAGQNRILKDAREVVSDDLLLRASRTFVDSDAKKADSIITKTAGNLLSQLSSVVVLAGDGRAQNRNSLERFATPDKGLASLTKQVNAQSLEGRSPEQVRTLADWLTSSKGLDGKGQHDRFGDTGLARQGGQSFGFSSQSSGLSDKAANVAKNSNNGNSRPGQLNDVQEQVRVNVQRAVNAGQDRIRLQLRPGELGRIDIRINVAKDGTYALRVFVEKQESLDLLRNDAKGLIDSLRENGIKTGEENLEFSLQEESKEQAHESKKKKGFGHKLEIEAEQPTSTIDEVGDLVVGGELDSELFPSEDDAEDRLNVVI